MPNIYGSSGPSFLGNTNTPFNPQWFGSGGSWLSQRNGPTAKPPTLPSPGQVQPTQQPTFPWNPFQFNLPTAPSAGGVGGSQTTPANPPWTLGVYSSGSGPGVVGPGTMSPPTNPQPQPTGITQEPFRQPYRPPPGSYEWYQPGNPGFSAMPGSGSMAAASRIQNTVGTMPGFGQGFAQNPNYDYSQFQAPFQDWLSQMFNLSNPFMGQSSGIFG